jgi:hypothetical protein
VSTAAGVWLFLVVIEWLADRFAGSLLHGWAAYWSAHRMQAAVHEISAKWDRGLLGSGQGVPLSLARYFAPVGSK